MAIKNSLKNKKIIAPIVAVIAVGAFATYNKVTVANAVNPVPVVIANTEIPSHTQITEDMLSTVNLPSSSIPPDAMRGDLESYVGMWTPYNSSIPQNSYLFENYVVDKDELSDSAILNLDAGEVAFPLLVDLESSSGNSILPNTYVDLYFKDVETNADGEEKVFFGGLQDSVRVTSVKDDSTDDVFTQSTTGAESKKSIAKLYTFAVTPEQLALLEKAKDIGEVIPIAKSSASSDDNENFETVSNQIDTIMYINEHSMSPTSTEEE